VSFGSDVITRRPSIPLAVLAADPAALEGLKDVLKWVASEAAGGVPAAR
jgi:hypothetical protein